MSTTMQASVTIQTSPQPLPAGPAWFGEVVVIACYLRHLGVLSEISERVRFARRRFGHYDLIDFVAVLLGYAISRERTLEAFYERVLPFANAFMALFGRDHLPASLQPWVKFPSRVKAQSLPLCQAMVRLGRFLFTA